MAIAVGVTSKGRSASASSIATSSVTTQAAGSTFVIGVIWNAGASFTSLVDSKGNTYTQAIWPTLITRQMVADMKQGSAIVDVAIDQGGGAETSRATTHSDPTYVVDGVVHYCVANMPGGVARTSTFALNNATLPFALALANKGWKKALLDDAHLRNGLNVHDGKVTHPAVARELGYAYVPVAKVLA